MSQSLQSQKSGYNKKHIIRFSCILHQRKFYEELTKDILPLNVSEMVLSIQQTNIGSLTPPGLDISTELLITSLRKIKKKFRNGKIKHLLHKYCSENAKDFLERCISEDQNKDIKNVNFYSNFEKLNRRFIQISNSNHDLNDNFNNNSTWELNFGGSNNNCEGSVLEPISNQKENSVQCSDHNQRLNDGQDSIDCQKSSLVRKVRRTKIFNSYNIFSADKCVFPRTAMVDAIKAVAVTPSSDEINSILVHSELNDHSLLKPDDLFANALPWKCVYRFLTSVLRNIIPQELFGSNHNFKLFQKTVKRLIMMGRYDTLYLKDIMFKVKISDCKYIKKTNPFHMKSLIIAKVWVWMLEKIVFEVIKAYFYVTESNHRRHQLFYFRKSCYQSLSDVQFNKLLRTGKMKQLSQKRSTMMAKEVLEKTKRSEAPPFMRLIPKPSGLRPILPLKDSGLSRSQIDNAKSLIKFITNKFFRPTNGIAKSLLDFESSWLTYVRSRKVEMNARIYAVKTDVQDAFGSIKHDLLFRILDEAAHNLSKDVTFGHFTVPKTTTNRKMPRFTFPVDKFGQCIDSRHRLIDPLVKAGPHYSISVSKTIENIKWYVQHQVGKVGEHRRIVLVVGIAQGGSLSSALCELYYAAMCFKHLISFQRPGCILLRCVDDFLYITPDKVQAQEFLQVMLSGIDEFNCFVSPQKTLHNIDEKDVRILFRGIVFCTRSQQLLTSVSSLCSYPPRYSLQLKNTLQPGLFIVGKLDQISRARFPSLIYHPSYVSVLGLISNIWRLGIIIGGRLVNLIKVLFGPNRLNERFICKTLVNVFCKAWRRMKCLWLRLGRTIPFSKTFFDVVGFGGIFITLGLPRHPALTLLRRSLRRKLIGKRRRLSTEETTMLPKPSRKCLAKILNFSKVT